jgi:DNA-binding transcriptional MerR regulator
MDDMTYSLDQLEAVTGLNSRKIRYYIQEVIGTGQGTGGRNARYPKSVLDKLLFVLKVKEHVDGLKLAEIREIIKATPDADIARVADGKEPLEVMDARRAEDIRDLTLYAKAARKRQKVVAVSLVAVDPEEEGVTEDEHLRRVRESARAEARRSEESWETIRLGKDAELRYRGKLSSKQRKQIELLGEMAQSILEN